MRFGVSAALMYPDKRRAMFHGSTLAYVDEAMLGWLGSAGADVRLLTRPVSGGPSLEHVLSTLDGLVLQGGADVAPETYGQQSERWPGDAQRDAFEVALFEAALSLGLPVLGICRGHQLLNAALGGTLFQDLPSQRPSDVVHGDRAAYGSLHHPVVLEDGWLARAHGTRTGRVSSVHHQAIDVVAPGLTVVGRAPDGVIEAVESISPTRWVVGVQWHPEFQPDRGDPWLDRRALLAGFTAVCRERR